MKHIKTLWYIYQGEFYNGNIIEIYAAMEGAGFIKPGLNVVLDDLQMPLKLQKGRDSKQNIWTEPI
ncbi:MAG: hypothetical protein GX045_01865 [Clostridiaceae bacterium]|jgi:hypothetical protein|nr:hypothetical protein [Clostridiaceae bacterium]